MFAIFIFKLSTYQPVVVPTANNLVQCDLESDSNTIECWVVGQKRHNNGLSRGKVRSCYSTLLFHIYNPYSTHFLILPKSFIFGAYIPNPLLMTAPERKQQTETFLKTLGIPVYEELPVIEEENDVQLRSVQEITARIMILAYLNCIATQEDLQPVLLDYLQTQGLWEKVSPQEKLLFEKPVLTDEEKDQIASRAECIWVLLWTINKIDRLTLPVNEADVDILFPLLPPFMEDPTEYITAASIRPVSDILNEADFIFRLYWAMSKTKLEGLNERITFERYFTITWLTATRTEWDN